MFNSVLRKDYYGLANVSYVKRQDKYNLEPVTNL